MNNLVDFELLQRILIFVSFVNETIVYDNCFTALHVSLVEL